MLTPGGRAGVAEAGFFDLRTGSRVRAVRFALAVDALLETARFLPVGVLAALSLPWTRCDRVSVLLAAAIAGTGSLAIAAVVLVLEMGPPWQWPGPSDLFLPAAGGVLGVAATLAWLAGRRAHRRLLLGLGTTLLAAPVLGGLLLLGVTEREPLVRDRPAVISKEKRRLYRVLAASGTRPLTLGSRDIDLLLAWGLPVVLGEGRGAAQSS